MVDFNRYNFTAADREAAGKMVKVFENMAAAYLEAIKAGLPQHQAFGAVKGAFERNLKVPPLKAANLARIVVAFVGRQVGEQVYSPADFEIILERAFS